MTTYAIAAPSWKRCGRCREVFPVECFYIRAGKMDSYCHACRSEANNTIRQDRESHRVEYHLRGVLSLPTATRKCRGCGYTFGNFVAFWPTDDDVCCFCGGVA
jgi:hypothetical protein